MRGWFENLGLKLTALTLAVFLWAYVGSSEVLERSVDLRLVFTNQPAGAVLTGDVKSTLTVVLVGRREKVLPISPGALKIIATLKDVPVPVRDYPIKTLIDGLPKGVAAEAPALLVSLAPAPSPVPAQARHPRRR